MIGDAVLELSGVAVSYGSVRAVSGIDLKVYHGRIATLIGSNGAGKTTILKGITGLKGLDAGRIRFGAEDLTNRPVDQVVAAGVSLVPEGRRLFPTMSVRENLEIGAYRRTDDAAVRADFDRVMEYFPALNERLNARAMTLSGGQQQMVAIGRALMSNPRLLLCDEISLGLSPLVVRDIYAALPDIAAEGVAIAIVEQDVARALAASRRVVCLREGRVVLAGLSQDATREAIAAAYFGV